MRKGLLLAVLIVAVMALPAFASTQNVKVSGEVNNLWLVRDQFDLGVSESDGGFYQNLLITQALLRVDADLTDNVSATVRVLSERPWDEDSEDSSNGDNDVDINLAFAQFRQVLGSNVDVTVGRQLYAAGNSLVMDFQGPNNTTGAGGLSGVAEDLTRRTALDAVRGTIDLAPLMIDVIAAKVDADTLTGESGNNDDVNVFGFNANYPLGDERNTVVEGYFWHQRDHGTEELGAGSKDDTIYLPGVHVSTNPIEGLNVQGEFAIQRGTHAPSSGVNRRRDAYAAQFISNYQVPVLEEYNPIAQFVYTYVSGDSEDSTDTTETNAWDPFFENQGGGTIYNTLFNLSNAHIYQVTLQGTPMEDVTALLRWTGIWLDKDLPTSSLTLLQPDGTTESLSIETDKKQLGNEFGGEVWYDYTEDVQVGLSLAWFLPGSVFQNVNDAIASQVLGNVDVAF